MTEKKKHVNAAYRLLELIQSAVGQPTNQNQFQVWIAVFRLQQTTGRQQKRMVLRGIDMIHEELDRLVSQVRAMERPEDVSDELVLIIDEVVTYERFGQPWTDLGPRLQKAVYPLRILNNLLPHEEKLIDPSELRDLGEELSNFEQSLNETEISPEIRSFVQKHIDLIRKAMWEYRVQGFRAFQEGIITAAADYANSEVPAEHADDPAVQNVRRLWQKVTSYIALTGKIGRNLEGVYKIYELAEKTGIIDHLKR